MGIDMEDFHTHTYLCEHAKGTPREYAASAFAKGLTTLGFSDHAPLPDGFREGVTMHPHQVEEYLSMIEAVREEFRDKLNIRIGFEVDYPLRGSFDLKYMSDQRVDYLIGSCHYLQDWPFDHHDYTHEYEERGIDAVYSDYYDTLAEIADSGLFNIIGHFDLTKKFGFRAQADMTAKIAHVAEAAARTSTAVEMNTSGLRKPVKEIYPAENIVKILFEHNVPVTMGSDAHAPNEVGADFDKASELLKKCGYRKIASFKKRKMTLLDL